MRILHLSTGQTFRGGEQQILLLMQGLRSQGHDQRLLAPAESVLTCKADECGFVVSKIQPRRLWDLFGVPEIRLRIQEFRPDILHFHDARAHGLGQLANRTGHIPMAVSRRVAFPMHLLPWSRRKFFLGHQRFLAVSHYVKKIMGGCGIPEDRIDVVYDCVDAPPDPPVTRLTGQRIPQGFRNEDCVLGYMGALEMEKGLDLLVEAMAKARASFPRLSCIIAGLGSRQAQLQRQIDSLRLADSVQIAPFPSSAAEWLERLDLFVLPSRSEGFGSVLLLAMQRGVPVLASDTGGIPEIVEEGKTGFLFENGNAGELEQAILKLIQNPGLRESVVKAAQRRVEDQFSIKSMTEATLGSYQKLVVAG